VAISGDYIVCAPEQGWPEDVALGLTDAPEAALACGYSEHRKVHLVMCSDEVHAVDWNNFRYSVATLWPHSMAHRYESMAHRYESMAHRYESMATL
jgi:hypothetical protein